MAAGAAVVEDELEAGAEESATAAGAAVVEDELEAGVCTVK
jgi:hypothetical protein